MVKGEKNVNIISLAIKDNYSELYLRKTLLNQCGFYFVVNRSF